MFALRNRRNPRKAIYTKEHASRREESFSPRERASCILLYSPACSFIRRVRVSRSHARVPFTRQNRFALFAQPRLREECWFLRYIPLGNLTYIITRGWAGLCLKTLSRPCKLHETVSRLFQPADIGGPTLGCRKRSRLGNHPDVHFKWGGLCWIRSFRGCVVLFSFQYINT